MPEGQFDVELVIDPQGRVEASQVLASSRTLDPESQALLVAWLKSRRYEITRVQGKPAYVCLPVHIWAGYPSPSASTAPALQP